METEASQSQGTGAVTSTLVRPSERLGLDPVGRHAIHGSPLEPKAPNVTGRTLAALARWTLFVALVVSAPLALIVWSVTPRVASPSQLADEAIQSGLTSTIHDVFVDQLSTMLAEEQDSPFHTAELRPVIERSISKDWVDGQLILLADELDRWLEASNDELPDLVIDLASVKASLASDNQALSLIAGAMVCSDPRCPSPESALVDLLGEVPDEVALLTVEGGIDTDSEREILDTRNRFQTAIRLIAFVPLVLAGAVAATVLFARRGSRIRWLGATLVVISLPVVAVTTLLPSWASRWVAASAPVEIALDRASLQELFSWAARPAGSAAKWMLLTGVAALVTSAALGIRRRRLAQDFGATSPTFSPR